MKKKIITTAIICSLSALAAAGCASGSPQDAVETTSSVNVTEVPAENKVKKETAAEELSSSSIELNGNSISAGEGAVAEGSHVTINSPGIYEISGKLDDGQIIVDSPGEIELVLNGVDIYCSDSAPIYVRECENISFNLTSGTQNKLADGNSYSAEATANGIDAVIYSKTDMKIKGDGRLEITGSFADGITGKDTLLIESGDISVTTVGKAISGKDYLMINGGNISVNAGSDGIKATNDKEASLGYVEINGGNVDITAKDEGISAIYDVKVTGGDVKIKSENNGIKSENNVTLSGGKVEIQTADDGIICKNKSISGAEVSVNGNPVV